MTEAHHEYGGPAVLTAGDVRVEVSAQLRAAFQPIDGHIHWYGRLAASPELDGLGSGATVTVSTPHATAQGRLSDRDPWGRLRVSGTGTPPF